MTRYYGVMSTNKNTAPRFPCPRVTVPGEGTFTVDGHEGRDCLGNPIVRYRGKHGIARYVAIGYAGVTWHA